MNNQQNYNKIPVFVYGTLKKGFSNNYLLLNTQYIGPAITVDNSYIMTDCGFPMVTDINKPNNSKIVGELYLVDDYTLYRLDKLESNGTFYTRAKRLFNYSINGIDMNIEAWIYLIPKSDLESNVFQSESDTDQLFSAYDNKGNKFIMWEDRTLNHSQDNFDLYNNDL